MLRTVRVNCPSIRYRIVQTISSTYISRKAFRFKGFSPASRFQALLLLLLNGQLFQDSR